MIHRLVAARYDAAGPVGAPPILFLNGQRDRIFCWNQAAFAAAARDGRLQVIARGSHRCNLEYPDAFTEAVRRFAQSIGW